MLDLVGAGWQRVTLAGSAVGGTTGFQQIRANGSFREIVIHGAVDASALTFDNRDFFSITLVGTAAAEQLRMASTGPPLGLNIIRPGSGADTIVGGNGNEFLYLSEGDLRKAGRASRSASAAASMSSSSKPAASTCATRPSRPISSGWISRQTRSACR